MGALVAGGDVVLGVDVDLLVGGGVEEAELGLGEGAGDGDFEGVGDDV